MAQSLLANVQWRQRCLRQLGSCTTWLRATAVELEQFRSGLWAPGLTCDELGNLAIQVPLAALPESCEELNAFQDLELSVCQLAALPGSCGRLAALRLDPRARASQERRNEP